MGPLDGAAKKAWSSFDSSYTPFWLPRWLSSKESTCQCRWHGSVLGSGRSPGGGNGNTLLYSCLGNPMNRGAWQARVHGGRKESDMTERQTPFTFIYILCFLPLWKLKVCSLCLWICFCFVNEFICIFFYSTYKWYHVIHAFVYLSSLNKIISRSIHVVNSLFLFIY